MDKIRLGRTNLMVSRLGFGSIPIQRVGDDEGIAVVKRCLELGINYFDTANSYTTSEERIGKAISGQRESVILATKSRGRTCEELESHVELSLKRLNVDFIDLYQFHNVSDLNTLDQILSPKGPISVLENAKRQGKIKHIGITSHQIDTAKAAIKTDRFETVMFAFNFIVSEAATELLPLAREHDVGYIAMKPLAGGRLYKNVALAIKYLLQFPDVLPIPGIEKVHQIEEIVQLLAEPLVLSDAEQDEMQRLRQELGNRFCRNCDYCQPCPAEIPISMVMFVPNILDDIPPERLAAGMLDELLGKPANCTDCGECEEKCPYKLPVRQLMSEIVSQYQAVKKKHQEQETSR